MPRIPRFLVALGVLVTCRLVVSAQQVPDRMFRPTVNDPAYAQGKGPVVCVDEAHINFHTLGGGFWAFGELVRRDGYVTRSSRATFNDKTLTSCSILVIANAQPSKAEWNTYPYPTPSAFKPAEVDAVHRWVQGGGRLLLIADHMPLAGAASSLASAFDVTFLDGFAVEGYSGESQRDAAFGKPTIFRTDDRTLPPHAIVQGRNPTESVASVRSFTGQAFQAPGAEPVLVLPSTFIALLPRTAWQFSVDTRRMPVGGWLQGAVMRLGSGRAAFFGEAAMFGAQVVDKERRPMGMNATGAEQNSQFVLNVMHWLSGVL